MTTFQIVLLCIMVWMLFSLIVVAVIIADVNRPNAFLNRDRKPSCIPCTSPPDSYPSGALTAELLSARPVPGSEFGAAGESKPSVNPDNARWREWQLAALPGVLTGGSKRPTLC